jgi:RNA 2',3'-cyclic 3'-phosphodiesterase
MCFDSSMGGSGGGHRVRAFLGLALPEDRRARLAAHVEECARLAPGYRWVPPNNLHLTLRFLGSLEQETLERLRGRLEGVRQPPYELELDGRGTFGPRTSPRVIWLGVKRGAEGCAILAAALEAASVAVGLKAEPQRFRPHVTVARARAEPGRLPELPEAPELEPWLVDGFVLYQSLLGREVIYRELRRYPLDGGET